MTGTNWKYLMRFSHLWIHERIRVFGPHRLWLDDMKLTSLLRWAPISLESEAVSASGVRPLRRLWVRKCYEVMEFSSIVSCAKIDTTFFVGNFKTTKRHKYICNLWKTSRFCSRVPIFKSRHIFSSLEKLVSKIICIL